MNRLNTPFKFVRIVESHPAAGIPRCFFFAHDLNSACGSLA